MTTITIRTNNIPRFTIDAYQLTEKEREEFDYYDWDAIDKGEDSPLFFRYKGQLYDIGEFVRIVRPNGNMGQIGFSHYDMDNTFKRWDAISSDSYFSGMLIRFADDGESVIVGQYFC